MHWIRSTALCGLVAALAGCAGTEKDEADSGEAEVVQAPAPTPELMDSTPVQVSLFSFSAVGEDVYFEYTDRILIASEGKGAATIEIPADGTYEFTIQAACDEAGGEFAKFRIHVGDQDLGEISCTSEFGRPYKATAQVKAGQTTLAVEFTNDLYMQDAMVDRNLYVEGVSFRRHPER